MTSPKKSRPRSNSTSAAAALPVSVQTTFRHLPSSPAVAARIETEFRKLHRYFDGITSCHVVIIAPHHHHRLGRRYAVHVELGVPGDRLVIAHEHAARVRPEAGTKGQKQDEFEATDKDIYNVIREVFDATRRRLQDYARRRRGEVKRHRRAAEA